MEFEKVNNIPSAKMTPEDIEMVEELDNMDTWIFSLGIAGILITAVTQNTTIMIITAACYGYIGGRLYGRDEK